MKVDENVYELKTFMSEIGNTTNLEEKEEVDVVNVVEDLRFGNHRSQE